MLTPGNSYKFELRRREQQVEPGFRPVFPDSSGRIVVGVTANSSGNGTTSSPSTIPGVPNNINGVRFTYGFNLGTRVGGFTRNPAFDFYLANHEAYNELRRLRMVIGRPVWLYGELLPSGGGRDIDSVAGVGVPNLVLGQAHVTDNFYTNNLNTNSSVVMLYVFFKRQDNNAWYSLDDAEIAGGSDDYNPRLLYLSVSSGFSERPTVGPPVTRNGSLVLTRVTGDGTVDDYETNVVIESSVGASISRGTTLNDPQTVPGSVDTTQKTVEGYAPSNFLFEFNVNSREIADHSELDGDWVIEEDTYRLESLEDVGPDAGGLTVTLRKV